MKNKVFFKLILIFIEKFIEENEKKRNQKPKENLFYKTNQDIEEFKETKEIVKPQKKKSLLKKNKMKRDEGYSFEKIWTNIKSFEFIKFVVQFIKSLLGMNPFQQRTSNSFARGRYENFNNI